jgi:Phage derived protein Gp49-like (DUF891)
VVYPQAGVSHSWRPPPFKAALPAYIALLLYYESHTMAWTVETLNSVVDAELEALPADMRARFHHISRLIEDFGLDRVREPHVKHLHGPLWEMRAPYGARVKK